MNTVGQTLILHCHFYLFFTEKRHQRQEYCNTEIQKSSTFSNKYWRELYHWVFERAYGSHGNHVHHEKHNKEII